MGGVGPACAPEGGGSQMRAMCVHKGEGVKKGQKTACALIVCSPILVTNQRQSKFINLDKKQSGQKI